MARLLGLAQVPCFVEKGDAKVTTEFGYNIKDYPTAGKTGDHLALDMVRCSDGKSSQTATICALADGVVIGQRKYVKGYSEKYGAGNCVFILHRHGKEAYITRYQHLKYGTMPDWIEDGAEVKEGDVLGEMGNTGYSFGAHLHIAVEYLDNYPKSYDHTLKGVPESPEPFLKGEKKLTLREKEYYVRIGVFLRREDAEVRQAALKVLGTDSEIEEVNKE